VLQNYKHGDDDDDDAQTCADMTGSAQMENSININIMCMLVQQDSWPPCLYWQLLVFIFGKDSWLQATAQTVTRLPIH
jgi:hypothetical protein